MRKSSRHLINKLDEQAYRNAEESIAPSAFDEIFVQPLREEWQSIRGGRGHLLSSITLEEMRERVKSEYRPKANFTDAEHLWLIAMDILGEVGDNSKDSDVVKLKSAAAKLGDMIAMCSNRQMAIRRGSLNESSISPQRAVMQLQNLVRDLVICASNVLFTINAKPGSDVTVHHASGQEGHEDGKEGSCSNDPNAPNAEGKKTEVAPQKRRPRIKGNFLIRRFISDCPYEFLPNRKSIRCLHTGKVYTISGGITTELVNRLTGGMEQDDWYVPLSGTEINHLRSACKDFLKDCVMREPYDGVRVGNHKWTDRARLRGWKDLEE